MFPQQQCEVALRSRRDPFPCSLPLMAIRRDCRPPENCRGRARLSRKPPFARAFDRAPRSVNHGLLGGGQPNAKTAPQSPTRRASRSATPSHFRPECNGREMPRWLLARLQDRPPRRSLARSPRRRRSRRSFVARILLDETSRHPCSLTSGKAGRSMFRISRRHRAGQISL